MKNLKWLLFFVIYLFAAKLKGQQVEAMAVISHPPAIIVDPKNPPNCEACAPNLVKISASPFFNVFFYSNNSFSVYHNISIVTNPAKLIKGIRAEISYFEFLPDQENCLVCNRDASTYGNFNAGNLSGLNGTGSGSHALNFSFLPPKPSGTFPVHFNISMPPTVNCCDASVRFCVRYAVTFEDCTVCNLMVCYERKMQGNLLIEKVLDNNQQNQ